MDLQKSIQTNLINFLAACLSSYSELIVFFHFHTFSLAFWTQLN